MATIAKALGDPVRLQLVDVLRNDVAATETELHEFARGALAHFKVPSAFHLVSELPKTATGKIQKFVLRGRRAAIAHQ